jgi:hypothetical protein
VNQLRRASKPYPSGKPTFLTPGENPGDAADSRLPVHDPIFSPDKQKENRDACGLQRRLDIDFSLEHKIRWAGEGDVPQRLIISFFKADFQSISPFDIDFDRARSAGQQVVNEG